MVGAAVTKYVGVPYFGSLKGHPNLKSGAEGPRETETDNPSSLMLLSIGLKAARCPLFAQSGQSDRTHLCPLSGKADVDQGTR